MEKEATQEEEESTGTAAAERKATETNAASENGPDDMETDEGTDNPTEATEVDGGEEGGGKTDKGEKDANSPVRKKKKSDRDSMYTADGSINELLTEMNEGGRGIKGRQGIRRTQLNGRKRRRKKKRKTRRRSLTKRGARKIGNGKASRTWPTRKRRRMTWRRHRKRESLLQFYDGGGLVWEAEGQKKSQLRHYPITTIPTNGGCWIALSSYDQRDWISIQKCNMH